MKKIIEDKIKMLRVEISAIDKSSNGLNLKMLENDNNRILELKAKIQVLTEILIINEKQDF